ncbi:hypothetical protein CHARACLAT_030271 [Characodon lateralis]|uniref:Uncharacterized protein n=1 Tax=Characodon lateralis TaxID=208331 RepID=A0ABU7DVG3_9TELE|nr:hypothetical protein [Characodon lateralis]
MPEDRTLGGFRSLQQQLRSAPRSVELSENVQHNVEKNPGKEKNPGLNNLNRDSFSQHMKVHRGITLEHAWIQTDHTTNVNEEMSGFPVPLTTFYHCGDFVEMEKKNGFEFFDQICFDFKMIFDAFSFLVG